MALQTPLVLISGAFSSLPPGDTIGPATDPVALASGNAGISTGLTALASGNAGLVSASNKVPISGGTMTGVLVVTSGSALLPAITPSNDPDTGAFSPGANQLAVSTSGVERVEFGNTEVVFNDGGVNYDFRVEGDTDANLLFVDASTDRVGVGTSGPDAQGGQKLTVGQGSIATTNNSASSNNGELRFISRVDNTNYNWAGIRVVSDVNANQGILKFYTSASNTSAETPNERCRIDADGRFYVGTTSIAGLNSNTRPVLAGNFVSFTGSVSAATGVATTLFALEDLNATYLVSAMLINVGDANYHAVSLVATIASNSRVIQSLLANSITLSLSGGNVQGTQGSGAPQTIDFSVTRIANL